MVFMIVSGVAPDPERGRRRRARPAAPRPRVARRGARAVGRVHRRSCSPRSTRTRVRFIEVTKPELEPWLGKTLADLVAARGGHPSDVFADWMLENDLRPGVLVVGVANSNVDDVAELLVDPDTVVASSDAGAHVQMMCAAGDTTLFLTRHVRDRGDLTVEQAVHELTGKHADVFGFHDRGRVAARARPPTSPCSRSTSCTGTTTCSSNDLPGGAGPPAAPTGRLPLHARQRRGHPGGRRAHRRPPRRRAPLGHGLTLKDSSGWPRD